MMECASVAFELPDGGVVRIEVSLTAPRHDGFNTFAADGTPNTGDRLRARARKSLEDVGASLDRELCRRFRIADV